jgi:predicted DNA-binding WGR domain protein
MILPKNQVPIVEPDSKQWVRRCLIQLFTEKLLNNGGNFMVTRPDVSQAVRTASLICVDAAHNSNKQWLAWVMPRGELYVEYGRVGYTQKSHVYPCGSVNAAQAKLAQLTSEKLRKGYQQEMVEDAIAEQLDFDWLEASEAQAIRGRLTRLQEHTANIRQHVNVVFDVNQGVFKTQRGVISRVGITQGRQVLRQIEACLNQVNGRSQPQFIAAVEQYLSVIPMNVGMSLEPDRLLGTTEQVRSQLAILRELEWGLAEMEEIRGVLRQALVKERSIGSDERARWLSWGVGQNDIDEFATPCNTGERAHWSRWE